MDLAIALSDTANEIKGVNFKLCDVDDLEAMCRSADHTRVFPSGKLSFLPSLIFSVYVLHLVADLPAHSTEDGCDMNTV